MSKVVVIDTETNIVKGIIMASMSDLPHANTYFVEYDPDNPCEHGNIYDPVAKTFELSPEQIKELEDKWSANLSSLQAEAWGLL